MQVKTASQIKNNSYIVELRTSSGNKNITTVKHFDENQSDLLFVLTNTGECYSIPREAITVKSSLSLGEKMKEYRVELF